MEHVCKNAGRCVNVGNSHQCQCQPGYTGFYCEEMVDECQSNPCRNGATCKDYQGTYECIVSTLAAFSVYMLFFPVWMFWFRFMLSHNVLTLVYCFSANQATRGSTVSMMLMNATQSHASMEERASTSSTALPVPALMEHTVSLDYGGLRTASQTSKNSPIRQSFVLHLSKTLK